MIRKGNVIFTVVLAAGLSIFFIFFLDPLLKCAIIRGGEVAFGARVELADVETRLLKGKVSISGLAIANKEDPMTNLLEIGQAGFQVLIKPLLEKKIVIEDAAVKGLTTGTPRKTSGALPKKKKAGEESGKPSFFGELTGKSKSLGLDKLDALKGSAGVQSVNPENLSSLKVLDEGKTNLEGLDSGWATRLAALKADLDTEPLQKQIDELKSGGSDPQAIAAKIKKAKELQEDIKRRQKNIKETKALIEGEAETIKKLISQAKEAKTKDLASLKDLAGIPSLDAENLAWYLLGPAMAGKVKTATHYKALAQRYMPTKEKADKVDEVDKVNMAAKAPARAMPGQRGTVVHFPKKESYPSFVWKHALLAGFLPGEGGALEFSGQLKDASSDPTLWPRPLTVHAKGERGKQSFELKALLDHRANIGRDGLLLVYRGYPLEGLQLGQSEELALSIKKAQADMTLTAERVDEQWKGSFVLQAKDVDLEPQTKMSGLMAQKLTQAAAGIRQFEVEVGFEGEEENLDFKLRSDIGKTLAAGLKSMFDQELAQQKKALEDKVNALYKERADQLEKSLVDKKAVVLGPLAKQEGLLGNLAEKAANQAKAGVIPSSAPTNLKDLKKLFK